MKLSFADLPRLLRLGVLAGILVGLSFTAVDVEVNPEGLREVRLGEFERIRPGAMKLAEVEAFLGRGVKIEETSSLKKYIWRNPDGSQILVEVDRSNQVVRAIQQGLH